MGQKRKRPAWQRWGIPVAVVLVIMAVCVCLAPLACFIPVQRTSQVCPGGLVQVEDADGRPIAAATVTVQRWSAPHHQPEGEWQAVTDAAGNASFTATEEEETIMPLMMHGVPEYSWTVCAEAEGHGPTEAPWDFDPATFRTVPEVVITLAPGEGRCEPQGQRD